MSSLTRINAQSRRWRVMVRAPKSTASFDCHRLQKLGQSPSSILISAIYDLKTLLTCACTVWSHQSKDVLTLLDRQGIYRFVHRPHWSGMQRLCLHKGSMVSGFCHSLPARIFSVWCHSTCWRRSTHSTFNDHLGGYVYQSQYPEAV